MAQLSGMVAILNEAGDQVIQERDLGPDLVDVKSGRAKPLEEIIPTLSPGERLTGFVYEILVTKVKKTWSKELPNLDAEDLAKLNATLIEEGSVVRALAELMFKEINKLRIINGDAAYTKQQFVNALKDEMRT